MPRRLRPRGVAAVRAYRGTGVVPTIKHFPGLGAADENTDKASVSIERSPAQLVTWEFVPFQSAISAGAPVVMLSHALYPALDKRRIASQSGAVVERLLRRRMGFTRGGDDRLARGRGGHGALGPGRAAVRSVRAGIDSVLTTGPGSHLRVVRALLAEARRSPAFEKRVTEAAARVIELRALFSER